MNQDYLPSLVRTPIVANVRRSSSNLFNQKENLFDSCISKVQAWVNTELNDVIKT